jgi:tripartite-type tricarboxylate transporter receptor subunit TctC
MECDSLFALHAAGVLALLAGASWGQAQNYPVKAVRVVAPDAGSGNDVVLRQITPGLSESLGQQVVIDNRGGVGGVIAIQTVAKAPPDGYTLLSHGVVIWLLPFIRDNVPWDPIKDFSPITLVARVPNILVVHPTLPVKSVSELIALAKARPGELNFGTAGGVGSATQLAAELFNAMAGVKIAVIAYKGAAPAFADLLAGRVQLMFPTASSVMSYVKGGRLRALAVTTSEPSEVVPGLPTIAATGLPGYESGGAYAILAPARTPEAIVSKLNLAIVGTLSRRDVKEKLSASGVEVVGNTPDQLAAIMKSEMVRMGGVIKKAGIHED